MPLDIQTTGKARELAACPYHAMTRDDEQQGILVAGHPHSTACARVAQQGGKFSVGACRAVGDLL